MSTPMAGPATGSSSKTTALMSTEATASLTLP
jgi:hypothetical protein